MCNRRSEEGFGDYAGEVEAFESVDLALHVGGGVDGQNRYGGLEQDAAAVVDLVDKVDGYAGLGVARLDHGAVDVRSVHAFAAVTGQERGVNVDDAVRITVQQVVRYHQQETGKDNGLYVIAVELIKHMVGIGESIARDMGHGHAEARGAFHDSGRGTVCHHKRHADPALRVCVEILYKVLGVRAVARSEHRYIHHLFHHHNFFNRTYPPPQFAYKALGFRF